MPKLNSMNAKDQKTFASKQHGKNGEACNLHQKGGDNAGSSHLLPLVMLPTCSFSDCFGLLRMGKEFAHQALNPADSRALGNPLLGKKEEMQLYRSFIS